MKQHTIQPPLAIACRLCVGTILAMSAAVMSGAEERVESAAMRIVLRADRPTKVVCLGDSVTGVYYHTGGQRAYPEMLEIALAKVVPNSPVKVVNAGISGNTTADGLARLDADVLSHHPDVVTISFGLNDMVRVPEDQFRQNLDTLVTRCRAAESQVVFCTPNAVITTSGRPVEKLRVYCEIIRQAGRDRHVLVCDQFAVGEIARKNDPWDWRLTLSDEIHPNMDGHKRMAEELCRTITGQSVSLVDVPPPRHPLAKVEAQLKAGQPVKVLAMPPFDTLVGPALKKLYPKAAIEMTPWPIAGKTLPELEVAANQTVRAMQPNLVILAIPRSAISDSDEQFVGSYSWVMNWSLSFGVAEWGCIVVHPSVVTPAEASVHDELVRRLVKAQDLHLLDRAQGDGSSSEVLFARWLEMHTSGR